MQIREETAHKSCSAAPLALCNLFDLLTSAAGSWHPSPCPHHTLRETAPYSSLILQAN